MLETWLYTHPLVSLFTSGFLSATLLPGGSEVLLWTLAGRGDHSAGSLIGIAALGNTLGGMSNWVLGWGLARYFPTRGPNSKTRRAFDHLRRWGSPALLFSWLPLVGDPLCVAAGWLGINGWLAMGFIALGKTTRYAVLFSAAG